MPLGITLQTMLRAGTFVPRPRVEQDIKLLPAGTDRHRRVAVADFTEHDWNGVLAVYRSLPPSLTVLGQSLFTEEQCAGALDALIGRGPNLVARAGGRVVGHAAIAVSAEGPSEVVVVVHPGSEDIGIREALLDEAIRRAREQGITAVGCRAAVTDVSARELYRRRGFEPGAPKTAAGAPSRDETAWWELDLTATDTLTGTQHGFHARWRGIAAAARVASIPLVCALVIVLVSQDPYGRWLASMAAFGSLAMGGIMHADEIIRG